MHLKILDSVVLVNVCSFPHSFQWHESLTFYVSLLFCILVPACYIAQITRHRGCFGRLHLQLFLLQAPDISSDLKVMTGLELVKLHLRRSIDECLPIGVFLTTLPVPDEGQGSVPRFCVSVIERQGHGGFRRYRGNSRAIKSIIRRRFAQGRSRGNLRSDINARSLVPSHFRSAGRRGIHNTGV